MSLDALKVRDRANLIPRERLEGMLKPVVFAQFMKEKCNAFIGLFLFKKSDSFTKVTKMLHFLRPFNKYVSHFKSLGINMFDQDVHACNDDIANQQAHMYGVAEIAKLEVDHIFFVYGGQTFLSKIVRSKIKTKLIINGEVKALGSINTGSDSEKFYNYLFSIKSKNCGISEEICLNPVEMTSKRRFNSILMNTAPFLQFICTDEQFKMYISSECMRMTKLESK